MILLVGDLHFLSPSARGRADATVGGLQDEAALVHCLDHLAAELTDVVLLGDLHDAYVEYRQTVPKGPTRLLGQLARFGDAGVRITYVVGNHDPWHRTFMEQELGFRLMRRPGTIDLDGVRVHLAHGDLRGDNGWARRIARHPISLALYTTLLPGDSGLLLAQRVSRRLAGRREDPRLPRQLEAYARQVLQETDAVVVAMGHCHSPAEIHTPTGTYLNPGFWPRDRQVGVVEGSLAALHTWDGSTLRPSVVPTEG